MTLYQTLTDLIGLMCVGGAVGYVVLLLAAGLSQLIDPQKSQPGG